MQQPGLDNRHRDKNGEISRKHGNTLIRTLRETYGPSFAPDCDPNAKLSDCLHQIDEKSLSQLVHDRAKKAVGGEPAGAPRLLPARESVGAFA